MFAVGHVSSFSFSLSLSLSINSVEFSQIHSFARYTEYLKLFTWLRCRLCLAKANIALCAMPWLAPFENVAFCHTTTIFLLNSSERSDIFVRWNRDKCRASAAPTALLVCWHFRLSPLFVRQGERGVCVLCERHANCVFIQHVNKIKIWFTNAPSQMALTHSLYLCIDHLASKQLI